MPEQQAKHGNKRGREITDLRDCLVPPDHLDDIAKAHFREIVELAPTGHFYMTDFTLLVLYCEAYSQHKRACKNLAAEGDVIFGENGPKTNPWVEVKQKATTSMTQLSTKLRLAPISRYAKTRNTKDKEARGTQVAKKPRKKRITYGDKSPSDELVN